MPLRGGRTFPATPQGMNVGLQVLSLAISSEVVPAGRKKYSFLKIWNNVRFCLPFVIIRNNFK